jgi:rare lipoprotein A
MATPDQRDIFPPVATNDEIAVNQVTEQKTEIGEQILNMSEQKPVSDPSASQEKSESSLQKPLWPSETGIATYYAPHMEGNTTASGEPYDSEQLTAAHRTIPIGSSVRVTNLKTHQQIIVRINDRWGGSGDRIINLSKQAATQIGFGSAGMIPVQLDIESLASDKILQSNIRTQPLPERLEENNFKNHSRLSICQNEADILGLAGKFHRYHVTACLSRSK